MKSNPPQEKRCRVAVFVSGAGTNMRALVEATRNSDYPALIVLIVSDNKNAAALQYAQKYKIPTWTHNPNPQKLFETQLHNELLKHNTQLITLAGFMRILSPHFCETLWPQRILNIHPSLLPNFPGRNAPTQAINANATESGTTIHIVTAKIDEGPILARAKVAIKPEDTPQSLHQRIKIAEHQLYPKTLNTAANQLLKHNNLNSLTKNPINWNTIPQNGIVNPPL
ncbi:MAG: phosphoribosylglycinamide formyltransferase [Alphaproteobacteria bacterium]